ncbi:uncharacterized protein LOC128556423 [Mercenaria mercenaria]|uniref:uncharacterized protein LOC128556423 n=1 Tax=Mercenaria mercenaria TaxID=6596 RepID=UPI00234EBF40|nr:uncharacterized protein LOC128556423 [Mercenaria mercenaria]
MERILDRTNDTHVVKEIDEGCTNVWRWQWLEEKIDVMIDGQNKVFYVSEWVRKIDEKGMAKCLLCKYPLNYGNRGKPSIIGHCKSKGHLDRVKSLANQKKLPSAYSGPLKATESTSYGIHPMFINPATGEAPKQQQIMKPIIPLDDRVHHSEAMLLGFVAEHSLSLTMMPRLINLAQTLAKDKKALDALSMDRTTASYKLIYGMKKTVHERTIECMREQPFSLNIDESTSTNNKHVLAVLVNYFDQNINKVVCEHLAALELIKVDTASIYDALEELFEVNEIPWTNLVSILMDSCAVMRGSKNGLEVRIRREKAPAMLDIDGDACHHLHNAAKKFCAPFNNWVENLFLQIYNDHKWSADLRDWLSELCSLIGVTYRNPERFISHRWLSSYDVAVSTLAMWDAYQIFYYAFVEKKERCNYSDVVEGILKRRQVSVPAKDRVMKIVALLEKKKMTDDGKRRKAIIVEKVLYQDRKTFLILNFYTSVLPLLKRYLLLFQSTEPMIHLIHDKQEVLFREFLSCYVKQEHILGKTGKQMRDLNIKSDEGQFLDIQDMFLGKTVKSIVSKDSKSPDVQVFMDGASTAYIETGTYLQVKLPLSNKILRCVSALDPAAHGHSESLKAMKKLQEMVPCNLSIEEKDGFDSEVHRFQVDNSLPDDKGRRLDEWWGDIHRSGKYPGLTKLALAMCTVFHGPMVESSFNIMGDIIDPKSANTSVELYGAIQSVKYHLKARDTSAVKLYSRKDILHDPVDTTLCVNLGKANGLYKKTLEGKRREEKEKNEMLQVPSKKPVSKTQTNEISKRAAEESRLVHEKSQLKRARERVLHKLVHKKKKTSA